MNLNANKVLPPLSPSELDLVVDPEHCYRIPLGRIGMEQVEAAVMAQRNADLARMMPLIEAAQKYLRWLRISTSSDADAFGLIAALRGLALVEAS